MSKLNLEQLTEGIRERHVGAEGRRLTEKWSRTGLLRGLEGQKKEDMARLLENQAAQVLRESNTLSNGAGGLASSGDIRGFSSVAFPIVRRVFAGLVANELVSVQPMSLPAGLLFYLDYTYGTNVGGDTTLSSGAAGSANVQTYAAGKSIYGNPTGKGVRSGSLGAGGMYDLVGSTYSKVHQTTTSNELAMLASGAFAGSTTFQTTTGNPSTANHRAFATGSDAVLLDFDPQITALIEADATDGVLRGNGQFQFLIFNLNQFGSDIDLTNIKDVSIYSSFATQALIQSKTGLCPIPESIQGGRNVLNVRRLNKLGTFDNNVFTVNPLIGRSDGNAALLTVVSGVYERTKAGNTTASPRLTASYAIAASLDVDSTDGSTLVIPSFESDFSTSAPSPIIPEIDIKIESISVVATTRKLRARWSPELAQDLNAYHSLDAEVELTQILSEQIVLEIDREVLNDLVTEASGARLYWSRSPGKFVNMETGAVQDLASSLSTGPNFTGDIQQWYQGLLETITHAANTIHRKTLRGSANFIVCGPDVSTILEHTTAWKPIIKVDGQGQVGNPIIVGGTEAVGNLNNRYTVYKDPYFPRNKILIGFKGSSYWDTGYVYAPYVPLIVTPVIWAPEDFTPRRGAMTRYAKKSVRTDFYATVTVMDLNVI